MYIVNLYWRDTYHCSLLLYFTHRKMYSDLMQICINFRGVLVTDFSNYQLNSQFLYSSTVYEYMLHYDPQHVSNSTLLILRRTNCITTASGNITLCKQPYSM